MGITDDQRERAERAHQSRQRHLASVRERAREELAGRAADLDEQLRLAGATDADTVADARADLYAERVSYAFSYTNDDSDSDADDHPFAVDVALTALDASSDRDFDCLSYEHSERGWRFYPADDWRGVSDHADPGAGSDGTDNGGAVPDMEVGEEVDK